MATRKTVVIGFRVPTNLLTQKENLLAYLSAKVNLDGRILITLRDYFLKHAKVFDDVILQNTDKINHIFPNGTITGVMGEINRSEVDIGSTPVTMNDVTTGIVDFSYPYNFYGSTFIIQKPEYEPQILGILKTFSLPLWIMIISTFIAMSLVYYVTLKSKYPLNKLLLHVFAVLLRQSSIVKPSSLIESLLVYSWVVGAMFICLSYDSVFLSFLAFPPVTQIRDVSDLASAVSKGEYHCFTDKYSSTYFQIIESERKTLKVIAQDLVNNNIPYADALNIFFGEGKNLKLALLMDAEMAENLNVGKRFVSEDRFLETMAAMMVRKGFCCKKLLETFVHRLMASGIYAKFQNDLSFLVKLPLLFEYYEVDSERKLTLTDVAPAFIFLLAGYSLSFFCIVWELLNDRRRKRKCVKKMRKKVYFC